MFNTYWGQPAWKTYHQLLPVSIYQSLKKTFEKLVWVDFQWHSVLPVSPASCSYSYAIFNIPVLQHDIYGNSMTCIRVRMVHLKKQPPNGGWKRKAVPLKLKIAGDILYAIYDDFASNRGQVIQLYADWT